ncbi:hypothetical protein HW561_14960 [Rhodobacteraceae bacterium B1Z28]|uniref:Uncharacterized protein n=1 Tax=Ruegeria haliotis TaxID=2747601 RepID=A0ABX2PTV5_9RHOB|nr:hypothetical protein [Ruegeria haliotis]NVO57091.1 hypothetical protein [Ruegeria haliotis]
MSKLDQIIANNPRSSTARRKQGFLSGRARILLLTLTSLLLLFVFFTQPPIREAVKALLG